ncbi:SPOSA6832_04528 [Sporobolomyces salmonicolor]|uniref:SPOSA6832_04528-mRNA-1:cds n=1 Tax=Sporidiobolus salmonicolor TaxID=5005 RepID=A0A0D6ERX1_SPOSA|nr:SPOSA6832_04528 [Sporobolomyces salmonicolor]
MVSSFRPRTRSSIATPVSPLLDSFARSSKRTIPEMEEDVKPVQKDIKPAKGQRSSKKRRKGHYADLGANPLTDRIKEGLDVLFVGENPGIRTAETQMHCALPPKPLQRRKEADPLLSDASPHNHFWKCLAAAGVTPSVLPYTDGHLLPDTYNAGITNLTSELSKTEFDAGAPVVLGKVARYRPKIVVFVGMKVCEVVLRYLHSLASTISPLPATSASRIDKLQPSPQKAKAPKAPKAQIGLQSFSLEHSGPSKAGEPSQTLFYCLPSTSGRVAAYPLPMKLQLYATFGQLLAKLRTTPPTPLSLPNDLVAYPAERFLLSPEAMAAEESVKVNAVAMAMAMAVSVKEEATSKEDTVELDEIIKVDVEIKEETIQG